MTREEQVAILKEMDEAIKTKQFEVNMATDVRRDLVGVLDGLKSARNVFERASDALVTYETKEVE